jgi:pyruvate formate lyase activating enzyme
LSTPLATVFAIKGNALDDGPGIRTLIFFKGCPLSCAWCHNPEGRRAAAELAFTPDECLGCGACVAVCPQRIARPGSLLAEGCQGCFTCVDQCPAGALQRVGDPLTVDQILEQVEKDRPFYDASGGGVTLSGGEPTAQLTLVSELARALRRRGIHVLLETCGHFPLERFDALLYPHLDAIYMDLKLADPEAHRQHCGVDNRLILRNFTTLARRARDGGAPLLPRIPLIPEVTATVDNLSALAVLLRKAGVPRVALVPYNPMWREKAALAGHPTDSVTAGSRLMTADEIEQCTAYFDGIEVVQG